MIRSTLILITFSVSARLLLVRGCSVSLLQQFCVAWLVVVFETGASVRFLACVDFCLSCFNSVSRPFTYFAVAVCSRDLVARSFSLASRLSFHDL